MHNNSVFRFLCEFRFTRFCADYYCTQSVRYKCELRCEFTRAALWFECGDCLFSLRQYNTKSTKYSRDFVHTTNEHK